MTLQHCAPRLQRQRDPHRSAISFEAVLGNLRSELEDLALSGFCRWEVDHTLGGNFRFSAHNHK